MVTLNRVEVQLIDSENIVITNVSRNIENNEILIKYFKTLSEKILELLIEDVKNLES